MKTISDPNPFLKKLGYSDNDRVVIFHADDISMSQASVAAYEALAQSSPLSSGAAMVPCPWFPALSRFVRRQASLDRLLDIGVHLTLTSEWDTYRWGPLTSAGVGSDLVDEEGYFFRDCEPVQDGANSDAVYHELVAQIDRALAAGIDVTHIDSHMGALFHPRFLPAYFDLAMTYRVPALMLRAEAMGNHDGLLLEEEFIQAVAEPLNQLEDAGFPLLDGLEMMSLDQPENRLEEATGRLERLPVGISYFIFHPAMDSPELRAYAPDWRCRVADYELFMDDRWRDVIEASGVKVIGWRALRELMPAM